MAIRPALLIPSIALLIAATAACGSASAGTKAAPAAASAPTAAPTSAPAKSRATSRPAVTTTKTVTVTVTRTAAAQPTRTTRPTASFAAFAGDWSGHTRFVSVSRTGRLEEHVGDGCCHPVIDMVMQLSNPHRVGRTWVADGRVVSAAAHDGWKGTGQPAPKPGDRAVVKVGADHILVESITGYGFCDPEETAPGTCGA